MDTLTSKDDPPLLHVHVLSKTDHNKLYYHTEVEDICLLIILLTVLYYHTEVKVICLLIILLTVLYFKLLFRNLKRFMEQNIGILLFFALNVIYFRYLYSRIKIQSSFFSKNLAVNLCVSNLVENIIS